MIKIENDKIEAALDIINDRLPALIAARDQAQNMVNHFNTIINSMNDALHGREKTIKTLTSRSGPAIPEQIRKSRETEK